MKIPGFLFIFAVFVFPLFSQTDYENIQVKTSYSGNWSTRQTKTVKLIQGYTAVTDGSDDFNRYGSYNYLRTDSTGFFYVKKIDGRWWLIDPNGYAGINRAVTSLTSSSIQNDYDILYRLAFNGTGNFLSSESQTKSAWNLMNFNTFSYTRRPNFYLNYKNVRKNYYTTPTAVQGSLDYILVFDPQFETYCNTLASTAVAPYATERDLLGYFTDNELNFNQDQLQYLVRDLPAGDPSRDSALVFAAGKGLTESDCINYSSNVTESIKKEFAALLADRYYKIVRAAIRKYDPNHLILGSRLHGRPRAIQAVVNASHKYMDVTSVNFYDNYAPSQQIALTSWTNDHPCLVGEFYIKDYNIFTKEQSGAGWYVNSQTDRGKFYQNTCIDLLKNKCYIGWHYFKFQDETDSNKGIVNASGTEYTDMTRFMLELNSQVYRLCDYYDGKNRRPVIKQDSVTVNCNADTYIVPGSSVINYGDATELEVQYNTTESNRRETFLKFDLSELKEMLPYLKHANLIVNFTATDAGSRKVYISGLTDSGWAENTLTGSLRGTNPDWKNGYNRLTAVKNPETSSPVVFDVSSWLKSLPDTQYVSFKLHELVSTTLAIKVASKEFSTETKRPRLTLSFYEFPTHNPDITTSFKDNFTLYPNPASNRINCKLADFKRVEIYNLNAEMVLQSNMNSLNIAGLTTGVYILKMYDNNGAVFSKKLIKTY